MNIPLNNTKQCINIKDIYDNLRTNLKTNTYFVLNKFKNIKISLLRKQSCLHPTGKVFFFFFFMSKKETGN